ncbi:ABC transporter substrate-binding protein [Paenibacillus abyssi]|uniref:ABC transporter substrate-binding protein n=1 Tax=Paenibacillus abyssi TaxID=1340531 RepID=A0A917D198_9BACL|nr:extracellular solute-binding protein [Paenibacillus abyssi]GGG05998.1 ABC transporter substrate-binding protein [Paenibacillus abyssi]
MKKLKMVLMISLSMLILLTACSNNSPEPASEAAGNNQSAAGAADKPEELKVLYATVEAGSEAIIDAAKAYEQQSGIKISVDTFPYNNLQEKVFSELAQKSDYYDLIAIDTPWVPKIIQHIEPMTSYIQNTKSPELLQLDDFIAKAFLDTSVFKADAPQQNPPQMDTIDLDKIVSEGFDIWSLPIQSNVLTVSYRKDLFNNEENKAQFQQQYNRELAVPQTLDEYLDIAKFFTRDTDGDGKIDLYGTTLMGKKHEANFVDFKSFLSDFGGSIFDDNLVPVFNNEAGVKALETYGSWVSEHKVTPPGVLTYTWDEVATVFGSGQVAMGMNYHDMKLDPKVEGGDTGYFVFPGVENGGEIVRGPHFGSWGIGISKYSNNKQAAYELAEALTSPDVQKGYLNFKQHVTRNSAYVAAEALPDALSKEYYQVLGESLKVGVGRPRITNYDQVSEAVQIAVSEYLSGKKDAKQALDDGAKQVQSLMEQAGY